MQTDRKLSHGWRATYAVYAGTRATNIEDSATLRRGVLYAAVAALAPELAIGARTCFLRESRRTNTQHISIDSTLGRELDAARRKETHRD